MGISEFDDTFLARWAEGTLTDKELETFKKSPEYLSYTKILEGTDNLAVPDFEQEKVLQKIQKQIARKPKVFTLNTPWIGAIAASIVIALGVFFVYEGKTNYNTKFGEQLAINLPDASLVDLNSKSKLAFNKTTWSLNRVVSLDGEAFFKVEKGSKFTVDTPEGIVTVKGTQFNVYSKSDYFEVSCYEGKVEISHPYKNTIVLITKGQQIRIQPDLIEKRPLIGEQPSWITGESTYDSVPLSIVINALENQYGIVITNNNVNTNQLFTGSFTHKDLRLALKTVFDPMNVGFVIQDKKNIIIKPL
jgi:transmembrane sensor